MRSSKRFAVARLGQLRDQSSIDLIESALHQEPPSDLNAMTYLIALGKTKGDKSKSILESYRNSKNDSIHDLLLRLLADW